MRRSRARMRRLPLQPREQIAQPAALIALLLAIGCTTQNPARSCADGTCSDDSFPYCDVDGAVTGEPFTCIAVSCEPGEIVACSEGGQAITCNSTGDSLDTLSCDYGSCLGTPTPHCPYLEPQYLPDVCDVTAPIPELSISNSGSFDTGLDTNCTGGVVSQAGGPDICVVRYGSIRIEQDVELTVVGTRALALVADEDLVVKGVFDVSGTGRTNGPGGGVIVSGGREGNVTGGGGPGFKTPGGSGGTATEDGGALNFGPASLNPAQLPALVGGPRSQGADATTNNSGGSGGAATLISCRGRVVVTGVLDAGGGGGGSGFNFAGVAVIGGCGGGAGGYLVLQGLAVVVEGQVFANGGGGGGGRPSNAQKGSDGGDAPRSMFGGFGGLSQNAGDGAGGSGGSIMSMPQLGKRSTNPAASAGGGGGSMGFFQSYTPIDVTPVLTPSEESPPFEENLNVNTR